MIQAGVIGLGSVWESRYREVLRILEGRVQIQSVFDPVFNRAEQVAEECGAVAACGVTRMFANPELDAILLFDTGWMGNSLLELACTQQKPIYLAGSLGRDLNLVSRLAKLTQQQHLTTMPEFSRRYTPATTRLQELLATQLKRAKEIRVKATLPAVGTFSNVPGQQTHFDFLVGLLDWCAYIANTPPARLTAQRMGEETAGSRQILIEIEYQPSRLEGLIPKATIELDTLTTPPEAKKNQNGSSLASGEQILCEITTMNGSAQVFSSHEIHWKAGTTQEKELLNDERPEVQVMLDHFCRRAVGGLISVPDLGDVYRNLRLAQSVDQSLETHAAVYFNEAEEV